MNVGVVCYHRFGEPSEVLRTAKKQITKPGPGEILVRMKARPINPSDLIPIRGSYSHRISLPSIPGYEGVGTVEEIGPYVSQSLLGKRVLPLRGEGTWQEVVISSADWAVPVPSFIEDAEASQLYINPITAWVICNEVLQLNPGDVLMINAGGSSIGRIFAQLSKILGFKLISLTRNKIYSEELYSLGAWQVINVNKTSLRNVILDMTNGQGAAATIDCIGGVNGAELVSLTRTRGTVISMGLLSREQVNLSLHARDIDVHVKLFHLRNWISGVSMKSWQEIFRKIIEQIERKKLRLMEIEREYDLYDIKSAIHAAETPGRKGKIILTSKNEN
jgi:NADPH:quinone reductase-like Zn-dependent oxidoreductase